MFTLTPKIQRALERAAYWHRDQTRKGSDMPYIMHPYGVAWIAAEFAGDEDTICAALLHDVIEDCDITAEQLVEEFGERVSELVVLASEPDHRPETWKERKLGSIKKLVTLSDQQALLVLVSDKLHNYRTVIEDYRELNSDTFWDRFTVGKEMQVWYYAELAETIIKREELPQALREEFQSLKDQLQDLAQKITQ